jgi:diguanylate cyclase (GGDEF)-like protein
MRDITERKLLDLEEKLSELALTDGLTGLANRRAFDEALNMEWKRTFRVGSQISLLLLDIDRFKQFNDNYGHQLGDDSLRAVSIAVRNAVRREIDIVYRYGGEEIAVVYLALPCTDSVGALAVAETVRKAIMDLRIPHMKNSEGGFMVTASVGIATALARDGGTMKMPESLLLSADQALYRAKHEAAIVSSRRL